MPFRHAIMLEKRRQLRRSIRLKKRSFSNISSRSTNKETRFDTFVGKEATIKTSVEEIMTNPSGWFDQDIDKEARVSIRNNVGKEAAISRHRGNYDSVGRVRGLIQLNNSFCRSETPPEGTSQSRPRFSPPRVRVSRAKCAPIWRSERELDKDQNSLTLSRGSRSLNATIQCS